MIYKVIVDVSSSEVDRFYDYSAAFPIEVGSRVKAPFGPRYIEGYVLGTKEKTDIETKNIVEILDPYPAIIPELLELAEYLKKERLRYIDSIRLFVPSKLRGGKVRALVKNYITLAEPDIEINRRAGTQLKIIEKLKAGGAYEADLNNEFSPSAVRALLEKGAIKREAVEIGRSPAGMSAEAARVTLTPSQKKASDEIIGGPHKLISFTA